LKYYRSIANNSQLTANGMLVNKVILQLVGKLLELPDYGTIVSETKDTSDVELLLDFILYVCWPPFHLFDIVSYSL